MHDQWLVTLLTVVAITPVAALGCALLYAVFLSVRRHLENRRESFAGRQKENGDDRD